MRARHWELHRNCAVKTIDEIRESLQRMTGPENFPDKPQPEGFTMSLPPPLVSVLIPAYNEQKDIATAIESVLHQRTRFPVEILVVDDGSSDKTAEIAEAYAAQHDSVKVIRNKTQMGKGYSICYAYNLARGTFVHILDADDVFSTWDKLQRQVDVLIRRTDCFAVAHNTLFDRHDGSAEVVPGNGTDRVYTYPQCYKNEFYCHTSSYLFRRLEGGLPEYFDRKGMRGDTAFFFFHAFMARKSVYVMKEVMSVYNINGKGIWTSLDRTARAELNIEVFKDLQSLVVRNPKLPEYKSLKSRIDYIKRSILAKSESSRDTEFKDLDDLIRTCESTAAKVFRPEVRAHAFQAMYSLPTVDALMGTVGRTLLAREGLTLRGRRYNAGKAVLIVSGFVPNGGGIFREIKEIVSGLLGAGFQIDILSTGKVETSMEIIKTHFADPLITYLQLDTTRRPSEQIEEALCFLHQTAPDRIYPFITHHDVVGVAAMQRGLGREIILDYVYDHGLSLGVHSSSIDRIVVKTHTQASALAAAIDPSRIRLLAPFFADRFKENPYRPLRNDMLTTASAAARPYKVEAEYRYGYFDVMLSALTAVNLRHIHYGPLSHDVKTDFLNRLRAAGVEEDRFVHIPWADDLGGSLLENGVDLFIAPFPVCSARISVEVMCCGIPSVNHRNMLPHLPEAGDFTDPDQLGWSNPAELVAILSEITAARLEALSHSARAFFCKNNASTVALKRFVDGNFDAPEIASYPRFLLNDLSLEPFFDSSLTEENGSFSENPASSKSKFWHRTPTRRRVRKLFYNLRGKAVENG